MEAFVNVKTCRLLGVLTVFPDYWVLKNLALLQNQKKLIPLSEALIRQRKTENEFQAKSHRPYQCN